jgi:hypothetical protein
MERNDVFAARCAVTYSLAVVSARDMELTLFASCSNRAAFFGFRAWIAAQVCTGSSSMITEWRV